MQSFKGEFHTFFFNSDFSGSVLIKDALFNTDEGMVEISGQDLMNLAKMVLAEDMIETLSAKYL